MTNTTTGGLGTIRVFNNSTTLGDVASILFQTYETSGSANRRVQISAGRDGSNSAGYFTVATRDSAGNFNENMRINSVGNVGIGTSSPGEKLEVQGYIRSASGSDFINIRPDSIYLYRGSAGGSYIDNAKVGSATIFRTSNAADRDTEAMRINANGNVGIGTTNPISSEGRSWHLYNDLNDGTVSSNSTAVVQSVNRNAYINVTSASSSLGGIQFRNTSAGSGSNQGGVFYDHSNRSMSLQTNAINRMTIDTSGSVGIGTTNPTNTLSILKDHDTTTRLSVTNSNATANAAAEVSVFNDAGKGMTLGIRGASSTPTGALVAGGGYLYHDSNAGLSLVSNNANGTIRFATGGMNEKVRIDQSGNVGIGTSSPAMPFEVVGNAKVNRIQTVAGSASSPSYRFNSDTDTGIFSPGTGQIAFASVGVEKVRIDQSGNVGMSTTASSSYILRNFHFHLHQSLKINRKLFSSV